VTNNESVTSLKEIKPFLRHNICLVNVKCYDFDKYGRLLADVSKTKDSMPFSKILVNEKLAYVYDGGKKLTEMEQLKLFRE
jgi:endonuclease YncB( thermonuclease family)